MYLRHLIFLGCSIRRDRCLSKLHHDQLGITPILRSLYPIFLACTRSKRCSGCSVKLILMYNLASLYILKAKFNDFSSHHCSLHVHIILIPVYIENYLDLLVLCRLEDEFGRSIELEVVAFGVCLLNGHFIPLRSLLNTHLLRLLSIDLFWSLLDFFTFFFGAG